MPSSSQPQPEPSFVFSHVCGSIGFGFSVYFSHYKDEFFNSVLSGILYALILWSVVSSYRSARNARLTLLVKVTHLLTVVGIIYTGLSHLFPNSIVLDFYVVLGTLGVAIVYVVLCSIPAAKTSPPFTHQ